MRIALVTNLYPPIQTGTAHWTRELAHHLSRAGHSVIVIACAADPQLASVPESDGPVTVYRLLARRLRASRLLLGFDEFFVANTAANRRRMIEILTAHDVQIVHQCGHLLDLTYATPRVARQLGIPCVCSVHTIIHSPTSRVLDWIMRTVDRTVVRRYGPGRYDALIALDAEVRAYIERTYRHPNVRTVLVSIDDDVLHQQASNAVSSPPFRILSVGHVTAMRSRLDLIEAVERLHGHRVPVELVIVGKTCDNAAQAYVKSRGLGNIVTFTGELPRDDVFELARSCHMEAHWITVPGLGTATLEAMALGLPVMAWAFPGLYGEVPLQDGVNLLFAKPGDVGQISTQIERLITSPERRIAIGAAGRQLVRQYLSWETAVRTLERIYGDVSAEQVEVAPASVAS